MKKIFGLLAAFALSVASLAFGAYVEEDVAPSGFDKRQEGVQYGELQQIKYYSKTTENERPVNVFVPNNYNPDKKYPVLYLLHGIGGNEFEWFGGQPNEVVGNLVAKGEAPEMIVVVPNIRVRHKDAKEPPLMSPEGFKEFDAFLDDFQTSLKPEIEKRYSVDASRESQAIAGLSMGGREALHLGIKLCAQIGYIGAFEPAPGLLPYAAEESLFKPETLTLPDEYKNSTYVFVTKGDRDGVVRQWPQQYAETLEKNGVDPHFVELHGGHDFKVWKESLYRFVKVVFKGQNSAEANEENAESKNEKVLFQANAQDFLNYRIQNPSAKYEAADGAVRSEITRQGRNPWDVGFRVPLNAPVEKGEVLTLSFKARTIAAQTEAGLAKIRVFFEQNTDPFTKSLFKQVEIGREFKEYSFSFSSVNNYESGRCAFGIFMGDLVQTLEVADVKLVSLGKGADVEALSDAVLNYDGQELDAPWRKAAEERIEAIRKGDLKIKVVDQNGSPMPTANVKIRQISSQFRWGTCVVAGRMTSDSEDAKKYRDFIEKYCNVVVFENDMKYFGWANPRNRANIMKALDWFDERGIAVRGHNLVWPSWRNSDRNWRSLENDPEALRKAVRDHVLEESSALKGRLIEWDVVNEPYDNRDIWQILGKEEIAEWFKVAREGDPDARLFLNDYGILSGEGRDRRKQDFYYNTLKEILDVGAPLGGIGMQGHFGSRGTPPTRVIEIIERFSELGLPIAITEHDIDSTDPKYQADFTRDFLTAAFSCEAVEEILTWGFWERSHWRPNAAYMSADWNLTPAGKVWTELVGEKWRSSLEIQTDFYGEAKTRVFCGEYEIEAINGGQENSARVVVPREGAEIEIKFN
ncbi:MAG: endo-1,4-beta-xylanase [Thermoguttaceae bacterium]|nr:endo-1,4-beta-xylanase [Thermoguttaceae bacterium]